MQRIALLIGSVAVILIVLRLAACSGPSEQVVLPKGPQTVTGVLSRVSVAVGRRGTHSLMQNGTVLCLVESATVNLRAYEGKTVQLKGSFEKNTDAKFLPVLVVTAATVPGESYRQVHLQTMGIQLDVPDEWRQSPHGDAIWFTTTGSTLPLLSIRLDATQALPKGNPIAIGSQMGILTRDDMTGAQAASVRYGNGLLVLRLTPAGTPDAFDKAEVQFRHILRSVSYDHSPAPSAHTSDTGNGQTCGGIIGNICPQGQYCQLHGMGTSTGSCVAL